MYIVNYLKIYRNNLNYFKKGALKMFYTGTLFDIFGIYLYSPFKLEEICITMRGRVVKPTIINSSSLSGILIERKVTSDQEDVKILFKNYILKRCWIALRSVHR